MQILSNTQDIFRLGISKKILFKKLNTIIAKHFSENYRKLIESKLRKRPGWSPEVAESPPPAERQRWWPTCRNDREKSIKKKKKNMEQHIFVGWTVEQKKNFNLEGIERFDSLESWTCCKSHCDIVSTCCSTERPPSLSTMPPPSLAMLRLQHPEA